MDFAIEELTMNAWPSLQTILYDGWIIRMAGGYTKRANSINPIYSYENDFRANSVNSIYSFEHNLDNKINYCENIYRNNNLPVVFKLLDCEEHKIIDKKLEILKYSKVDLTSVQICNEIRDVKVLDNINIENKFSENWRKCFYICNNIENIETIETIEKMLENIKHRIINVYKMENEVFVGCGYGVIERDFVGLFDIVVKENFRGKGYGKEIVETILAKSKETGIKKAYLAVVDNNTIAKNLYERLGFKEIYKYWYRKKD
jgi:GNAT superfamily N-acetyltransferase